MFKRYLLPIASFSFFLSFFSLFPLLLIFKCKLSTLNVSICFLSALILFIHIFRAYKTKRQTLNLKIEDLAEEINLVNSSVVNLARVNEGFKRNIIRYNTLEDFVGDLNRNSDLNTLLSFITARTFGIFEHSHLCLIYLVNPKKQELELVSAYKNDSSIVIKAKQGDALDKWVFRHHSPLVVEDIKNDFRFDLEKIMVKEHLRDFTSVISAPLISEGRLIGTIRLESLQSQSYNTEDLRFLNTLADVSALAISSAILYKRTEELAITDSLTGLFTRNHLIDRLGVEISRSIRQNKTLSIFILDIDFFKNYNDQFGHTAGDIVLKRMAKILSDLSNGFEAIVSRYGGEEFAVVIPEMSKDDAIEFAERMRSRIANENMVLRRKDTSITVSIGLACFPENGTEPFELIKNADQALLKAKREGRNRVCIA